jgi:5-methylcytosine-specific restriction endonuclease McrA
MTRRVRPCRNCSAVLRMDYKGERCPFCLMLMAELETRPSRRSRNARRRARRREAALRFGEPLDAAGIARRKDRADAHRDAASNNDEFTASHAGYPLGRGYPMGESQREDGETHREAWMRLLRTDPCSYCDGEGGTVDHIIPRSTHEKGLHTWLNYAGACGSCNGSKGAKPLLLWLAERGVVRRRVADAAAGGR